MLYTKLALLAMLACNGGSEAFKAPGVLRHSAIVSRRIQPRMQETLPCAQPEFGVLMNDVPVSAATLRSMDLADATGTRVRSGSLIGYREKAIVVFLRHLG